MAFADRQPNKDFNNLIPPAIGVPRDLWSDGVTLFVSFEVDASRDSRDDKIYAYNLSTKIYDANKDFNTLHAAGNNTPSGLWSDGTTMWVSDTRDGKIYAYNLLTKIRDANKDFNTLHDAGNTDPDGLWSDGTTMWVADAIDGKIYAYNLSTKIRDANKDFNTLHAAGNTTPNGLWSDGTTMWVSDSREDKIYAYNLSTKIRDANKDFNTLHAAGNTTQQGIWSDGTTMWVADFLDGKIYAYELLSTTTLEDLTSSNWVHVENHAQAYEEIYLGPQSFWRQGTAPVITAFTVDRNNIDLDTTTGNIELIVRGTGFTNGQIINQNTGEVVQNFATNTGVSRASTPIPTEDTTFVATVTNNTGATSSSLTVRVTKNPVITNFRSTGQYHSPLSSGSNFRFAAIIDGRPQPALSADQGIGAISTRHLTRRSDGRWDLDFTHVFGIAGSRTITLTATNSSGSVTAQTTIVVP